MGSCSERLLTHAGACMTCAAIKARAQKEQEEEEKRRKAPPVLDNVSFAIEAGTSCALVGKSGAGKTTSFQLLLRFYDPSRGELA